MALKKNPQWTLLLEDGRLIALGGADHLFLLDELTQEQSQKLFSAYENNQLDSLTAKPLQEALALLVRLGILLREEPKPLSLLRYRCKNLGPEEAEIQRLLLQYGTPQNIVPTEEGEDLLLVFRLRDNLLEAAGADYGASLTPHLLVDIGFHHTISLGPLVWPKETACLLCFAGRIRHAWGDPRPPQRPRVSTFVPLVASILFTQLVTFQERGNCPNLVSKTISMDVETLRSQSEAVHRLPWCPVCFPEGEVYGTGSFALPWLKTKG